VLGVVIWKKKECTRKQLTLWLGAGMGISLHNKVFVRTNRERDGQKNMWGSRVEIGKEDQLFGGSLGRRGGDTLHR